MNLSIPWNAWYFFPYWGNDRFSRKTLPHDIDWLTLCEEYKLYISLFLRLQQNTLVRQYMHSLLFYIILSPTSSTLIKPSSERGCSKDYILSTGMRFHVTVQTKYPSSARYGGTRHRLTCSTLCVCVCVFLNIHLFTSMLHYCWVILHALFSILHTMVFLVYIHFRTSTDYFCSVLHSSLYCLCILWIFYGTVLPNLLQLTGQFSVLVTTAFSFSFSFSRRGESNIMCCTVCARVCVCVGVGVGGWVGVCGGVGVRACAWVCACVCARARIGHILHRNCLIKHVIEGKMQRRIKMTGRRRRRRKRLLDDFNEKRGYWKLKKRNH